MARAACSTMASVMCRPSGSVQNIKRCGLSRFNGRWAWFRVMRRHDPNHKNETACAFLRVMNLPNLMKWTVAVGWGVFALHTNATQATVGPEYRVGGFVLGCQAYMFHRFTAFEAIERTAAAGGRTIEFYPGQSLSPADKQSKVDPNATDETIQKLKANAKQHVS